MGKTQYKPQNTVMFIIEATPKKIILLIVGRPPSVGMLLIPGAEEGQVHPKSYLSLVGREDGNIIPIE